MVEAYKKFLTNYANFNGRSTRSDYWYVALANFIIGFVLGFIGGLLHIETITTVISAIYMLATLVPSIAIVVRRLHDINKSGWYYFMVFIPLVGIIILLVYLCTPSMDMNNPYGERV